VIDIGTGYPIVLIPGIQGRWEWMRPAVDALRAGHRVLSFSLQEARPQMAGDDSFAAWLHAVDAVLDRARERRVALVGVSFGGLIAAQYAARRPERVSALVLASTPPPDWRPDRRQAMYMRFPRLAVPFFAARGFARLVPEVFAARPTWPLRLRLGSEYAVRVLRAPISPRLMARWVRELREAPLSRDVRKIVAPTLVLTGESRLDRVVPVASSLTYLHLIPGAQHAVLPDTGHVGLVTRPYRFAEMVGQFVQAAVERERQERAAGPASRAALRTRHAS
jgi:pimeloyl-ACP methyl ester carboxylesterase